MVEKAETLLEIDLVRLDRASSSLRHRILEEGRVLYERDEGCEVHTPREALKKAYEARWIDDEEDWLQMLSDRNETSHLHDEKASLRIYESIRARFPIIERAYQRLRSRG